MVKKDKKLMIGQNYMIISFSNLKYLIDSSSIIRCKGKYSQGLKYGKWIII